MTTKNQQTIKTIPDQEPPAPSGLDGENKPKIALFVLLGILVVGGLWYVYQPSEPQSTVSTQAKPWHKEGKTLALGAASIGVAGLAYWLGKGKAWKEAASIIEKLEQRLLNPQKELNQEISSLKREVQRLQNRLNSQQGNMNKSINLTDLSLCDVI